ncbi:5-(carboxyamino)imidazole ribonucleotide synthase [Desertimonas flava]|uniref:5-(carboxyamino)imidazole ribonucleotide synthase n=1 Tax=Desertimonas flava TaxID=2064846 RepID=UPI000E34BB4E
MVGPPATIGMLGGGQLGRYALIAARIAGYRTIVCDPDPAAPAGRVADVHLVTAYDDPESLDRLAAECAVVTTEFENPPATALERLAADTVVAPSAAAVAVAQDRIAEKTFLAEHGIPVAPWAPLVVDGDLARAAALDGPVIVKSARLGYDGKGQIALNDGGDVAAAWRELGGAACVVERRVPLDVELSVVCARSADGAFVAYPVAENEHRDGILDLTIVPARIEPELAEAATGLAESIASALDYVGVLAVEIFVSDGELLVNELAPRPHNSGHWTLDAAGIDQFALQIRAITGSALGGTTLTAPAVAMVNLLGDLWPDGGDPDWSPVLGEPAARLHLYGKSAARRGRKMGHVTVVADDPTAAGIQARALRAAVASA